MRPVESNVFTFESQTQLLLRADNTNHIYVVQLKIPVTSRKS